MSMASDVPTCDDRPLWDTWLSMLWLPAVTVADELGIFDALAPGSATPTELAERMRLDPRAMEILLPLLTSLGFLVAHLGRYQVNEPARNFLLHSSPFYWGGVFMQQRRSNPLHTAIRAALTRTNVRSVGQSAEKPPVDAWESGQLDMETARGIAAFMHSHSLPAATGVALHGNFAGITRMLDVGGGSGCFSITIAQRMPNLRCTIMDLGAMCAVAAEYVNKAGVADRVDTRAADMFRDEWPGGYDATFFSNIFHDWSFETCARLAARAYALLPAGGRIFLHEMLLDDTGSVPRTAAAFSMLMLISTRGQQFTFRQLQALLERAGFVDVDVAPTYGYYSLVRAVKR
jgi:2-polyprenyl-3-methyl-5-hydroxy-6-metoxy-1,4-benzoquinol methylase